MKIILIGSRSNPKLKRKVVLDDKGQYHCSCPLYLIKHKECYHIKEAKKEQ